MTATYIATAAGNHGIDYVTDSGKKGFVIGILDEKTARTLAAGPDSLYHLKVVVEMLGPEWFDQSEVQKAIEYIQTIEPEYKP
jgi:hypothetical protein